MATEREAARRDELREHLRHIIDAVHAFDHFGGEFASTEGPFLEDDLPRGSAEIGMHSAIAGYICACGKHAGIEWRHGIKPRVDEVCAALSKLEEDK